MSSLPKPDHEQETHDKSRDTEGGLVVRSDGREEITYDDPRSPWIKNAEEHARLEGRIDVLDVRMENLEGRMGNIEDRMGKIEDRMGNMEGRMGKLETKVENIEGHLVEIKEEQKTQRAEIKAVREAMIASFEGFTAKFFLEMKAIEERFDKKRDEDIKRSRWQVTTLIAIILGAVGTIVAFLFT